MNEPNNKEQTDITKIAVATIIGVIVLAGAVWGAYQYSKQQASNIILPGGVTYLGPTVAPKTASPTTAPPVFTAASDVTWATKKGNIYPFSFSYPSTLTLVVFTSDITDSITINWGNIPVQQNLLLNMELIDSRDSQYVKKPKLEFVNNWYRYFSGLKEVESVEKFTNINGLVGYKAKYLNYTNASPNIDIFFEVPKHPQIMIHLA